MIMWQLKRERSIRTEEGRGLWSERWMRADYEAVGNALRWQSILPPPFAVLLQSCKLLRPSSLISVPNQYSSAAINQQRGGRHVRRAISLKEVSSRRHRIRDCSWKLKAQFTKNRTWLLLHVDTMEEANISAQRLMFTSGDACFLLRSDTDGK